MSPIWGSHLSRSHLKWATFVQSFLSHLLLSHSLSACAARWHALAELLHLAFAEGVVGDEGGGEVAEEDHHAGEHRAATHGRDDPDHNQDHVQLAGEAELGRYKV